MNNKDFVKLILALLICHAALVYISGQAGVQSTQLGVRPGVITLYVLMGVSLFLVWRKVGEDRSVRTAAYVFFSSWL